MIKFETHTLSNGLRIYLAPMQETQAMTLMFVYGVGSRYETAKQNGLSHFLEHMFFKGTLKRPTTLDISQELDALGASYNAYTSEESTGYYVSAAAEHFPIAFDVLSDMLYGSVFESEEVEREKGVICEEIKMYADDPMGYLEQVSKSAIYGDSPLGRDIAGTAETVRSFTREDFVKYREHNYTPENTIVVVAGNPAGHDWLESITDALSKLPKGAKPHHEAQLPLLDCPSVTIGHKPIDQVNLSLMHYGINHRDPRVPIVDMLTNILGGTMSSRLFVEVREKRGLAYRVWSHRDSNNDIGTIDCAAGVALDKLDEAVVTILGEIERIKNEPVTDVELNRAKQNIKGRLSLRLEDSHSIARYLAYDELELGEIIQPEEYIAMIEKVNQADIMRVAKELLTAKRRKLALVGPLPKSREPALAKLIAQ